MRVVLAAAAAFSLSACATGYHAPGITGGVSAMHLDSTTVKVVAKGNGMTSLDTIQAYAMRKAAEETLASGYDYFAVMGAEDRSSRVTGVVPGYAQTNGVGTANVYGGTVTGTYSSSTMYTPARAYDFTKPGQALIIKLYKAGEQPKGAFKASEVLSYLVPATSKKK